MCIILWGSLGCSSRSLPFGPGECFGIYFSIVCFVPPSRVKGLPLRLFLLRMALCSVLSILPSLLWQASVLTPLFFRLQLVTFFEHIRSKRRLMEIAADRLSIRW